MESHVRDVLQDLGEDPRREGLVKTPHRVAKAWRELTSGYRVDVDALINGALFTESYNEMVLVRDISFYSLCEHHMLPFFGRAHVAYLPHKKIVGLSKIPKLVEVFARRLQVQERMTLQIAEIIEEKLKPKGVAVVLEARHLCMEMRGAESHHSPTTTSCMLGVFQRDARTRKEFLELVRARPI
ncbi:MAG: GTP cyclohydrolase I FolE [Elusimicrobia bacterium]|nr:GTP cyclohydrolase I FolE [Elusimicrobiota bacterium]